MHKSVAALVSIVLAVAFLAACGDSGSSSSTTTKTATVPSGKLGSTGTVSCTPPRVSGTTVHALNATNVSCDVATNGFNAVYRTNKFAGWTCKQTISGRNVRVNCTNDANTTQAFSSSWSVS